MRISFFGNKVFKKSWTYIKTQSLKILSNFFLIFYFTWFFSFDWFNFCFSYAMTVETNDNKTQWNCLIVFPMLSSIHLFVYNTDDDIFYRKAFAFALTSYFNLRNMKIIIKIKTSLKWNYLNWSKSLIMKKKFEIPFKSLIICANKAYLLPVVLPLP